MNRPHVPAPSRRALLGALAVAPAVALPPLVASSALASGPHPDAALFVAETTYREAKAAYEAANERASAAREAYRADLGACPPTLVLTEEDREAVEPPYCWRQPYRAISLRWVEGLSTPTGATPRAWTAPSLRIAIAGAVPVLGQGGRTPHRIRRWRSLLPVAEAFDAHCAVLDARHQVNALHAAVREADKARIAAEVRFGRIPARTVEGLAAKVRHMDGCAWMNMHPVWIALLQSAAAVAGVPLRGPRFDCERWAREVREAGGTISWDDLNGVAGVVPPPDDRLSPERAALLARLSEEQQGNREEIAYWLSQGGAA